VVEAAELEVTLYFAAVPVHLTSAELETRLAPWLSASELAATRLLSYPPVRHEQLVTRALARAGLSSYRPDVAPETWEFRASPLGKPAVTGPAAHVGLGFNLSHSHGLVVCALTDGVTVGVDVEWRGRKLFAPDMPEMGDGYFSLRERAALLAAPAAARGEYFFKLWTLKEAYLKALGSGLDTPLESFTIIPDESARMRIAFGEREPEESPGWAFWLGTPAPEHQLAVCLQRPAGPPVRVRDAGYPLPIA
jgi:4'-phosphopantetheinyl transferase